MASNYDNSAWFYDSLSRLVYGKALVKAQVYLLQFVPSNSNILIAGGGTGWILQELASVHPSGLNITYVEISARMMALSKKRSCGTNQVTFIMGAVEDVALTCKFDVIITPFLFDNFTEQTLRKVFDHLHHLLKPGGVWLNCDFQLTGKWWQRALLQGMFIFFRTICHIEASKLPDIKREFETNGYEQTHQETFLGHFVFSAVYRKSNDL